jgi:alcohol dehydrogenase class IV
LIGVAAQDANTYADNTVEIDIMIIAEPKKVTKDDLERMLAQATDL